MEPTMNPTPTSSSAGDCSKSPDSPQGSEKDDGVDFNHERESESNEAIDTENGSRSVDKNQTEDEVRGKDSQTEADSLDEDVEIVIKNQKKYYIYCPCCGEDITKTVKLVKKSDLQPTENTKNEVFTSENSSRSKDKTTTFPSLFPAYLQPLFLFVNGYTKKKGNITKSPVSYIDPGINDEEPNIDVRPSFPKWYLDVFAWLFLCIIIALSVMSTSPQPSSPFSPPHLELPSISSLRLPSGSVLFLLPMLAVLVLVFMAMKSSYILRYQGDKRVESKSSDITSKEQSRKIQNQDDQAAAPGQDYDKKTDNIKIHPTPLDSSPREQPSEQHVDKETHENQAEPKLQSSVENRKGGNKLEILKSVVYGGLTQSITSLCTVTSAVSSGASTLNVLVLGVANLSSGLLLIVHSLQELINEKPRNRTNTEDQENSESDEDRYEETLGRRERSKLHSFIAISSFLVCGLIPPLVYGFSFRRTIEKRQEYKTLAVYAASLICIVLLSTAKAYVSKRREYLKTLFRYTTMATTASGFSQFVGYLVNQWLKKTGFYDDSSETPQV